MIGKTRLVKLTAGAVLACGLFGATLSPGVADANAPTKVTNSEYDVFIDPFLSEQCGQDVVMEADTDLTLFITERNDSPPEFQVHLRGTLTATPADGGSTLVNHYATVSSRTETTVGDGDLLITEFSTVDRGNFANWHGPGFRYHHAGKANVSGRIVFDTNLGDVVESSFSFDPVAGRFDQEDWQGFCGALAP